MTLSLQDERIPLSISLVDRKGHLWNESLNQETKTDYSNNSVNCPLSGQLVNQISKLNFRRTIQYC